MDGDLFGDALVDDLLNFTRESSGDFDTSDLMDILEPDHLENNILLDDAGSLDHMPDVAALDELDDLAMSTEASSEGSYDESQAGAEGSQPSAQAGASLDSALDDLESSADDQEDEEDYDPLEALTSSMLPEDDLEALARLAAGEDITPARSGALSGSGALPSAASLSEPSPVDDPLETEVTGFSSFDAGLDSSLDSSLDTGLISDLDGDSLARDDLADSLTTGKNLLEDTLDERLQPNAQELEELTMLASGLAEHGGEDLGSLVDPSDDGEDSDDSTDASASSGSDTRNTVGARASSKTRSSPASAQPEGTRATDHQQAANQPQRGLRQFSQVASTWQSQTSLATPQADADPLDLAPASGPSPAFYRPPNQLRRHFNASIMLEAADRLKDVLDIPDIPAVVFLGRAAERCLGRLEGHDAVSVAHLAGSSFVASFQVPQQESFRRVLLAKRQADQHQAAQGRSQPAGLELASDASQQALLVADISELELDDLTIALEGSHLLLTRLQPDPNSQHLRGTLTLVGDIDLRAGAMFLKAIKDALESPITLMV
ncbi:MAG: hypothetical protein AAF708_06955 [Deinococcota bacterium]